MMTGISLRNVFIFTIIVLFVIKMFLLFQFRNAAKLVHNSHFVTLFAKFKWNTTKDPTFKWKTCVHAIQQRQLNLLADKLTDKYLLQYPVILVDPAYHGNVGDNLLNYGELIFIEKHTNNHAECGVIQSGGLNNACKKFENFSNNSLVLWHAGRNWGDIWNVHYFRMKTFMEMLRKNMTIISMPQSLHYNNKDRALNESNELKEIIINTIGLDKAKQQIVFTWRQEDSYQKALNLYPYVDNRLVPDIAFMIGSIKILEDSLKSSTSIVDLLFLLRTDTESVLNEQRKDSTIRDFINEMSLSNSNITFRIVDWADREKMYERIPNVMPMQQVINRGVFDYNSRFASAAALISSGRILITDRLHASILAFLCFKPHVFIDQMYRKIEMTRNVAFNSSTACQDGKALKYEQSDNLKEAVKIAISML